MLHMFLNEIWQEDSVTMKAMSIPDSIFQGGAIYLELYVAAGLFMVVVFAQGIKRRWWKFKSENKSGTKVKVLNDINNLFFEVSGGNHSVADTTYANDDDLLRNNWSRTNIFYINVVWKQEGLSKGFMVVLGTFNSLDSKEKGIHVFTVITSSLSSHSVDECFPLLGSKQLMKFLAWNCQGMRSPLTKFNLKDLYVHNHVSLLCLFETKSVAIPYAKFRRAGFVNWEVVNPCGRAGGMLLCWKDDISIDIIATHKNFIHCLCLIPGERTEVRWDPPPQGLIKINCDASFCASSGISKIAAVARNEKGDFLAAMTSSLFAEKPLQSEGQACALACFLAKEMGIKNSIVETDCKSFVDQLKGDKEWDWTCLNLFHYCRKTTEEGYISSCCFCPRNCNRVAHYLANSIHDNQICTRLMYSLNPEILKWVNMDKCNLAAHE